MAGSLSWWWIKVVLSFHNSLKTIAATKVLPRTDKFLFYLMINTLKIQRALVWFFFKSPDASWVGQWTTDGIYKILAIALQDYFLKIETKINYQLLKLLEMHFWPTYLYMSVFFCSAPPYCTDLLWAFKLPCKSHRVRATTVFASHLAQKYILRPGKWHFYRVENNYILKKWELWPIKSFKLWYRMNGCPAFWLQSQSSSPCVLKDISRHQGTWWQYSYSMGMWSL